MRSGSSSLEIVSCSSQPTCCCGKPFQSTRTCLRALGLSQPICTENRCWPSGNRSTNLSFNLSHTSGLVACVICRRRDVGIDVESLDREVDWREIASRFFSAREVTSLHGSVKSDEHAHFTELWTLKEAYIKAIGTGLSHPLHTFSFVYTGATSLRFEPAVRDEQSAWQFALFAPTARHRMAVAAGRTGRETLRMTTWGEQSGGSAPIALRTSV